MRGLDGITDQCSWVWVSSGIWWWTGRPSVLQSMGSQKVRHNWATELNWNSTFKYTKLLTRLRRCSALSRPQHIAIPSGWNAFPHTPRGVYTQTHTTAFITFWHKRLILIHWAQRPFLPRSPPPPPIIICAALRKDSDAGKIEGKRRRGQQRTI